ncbi:hypothetical protein ASE25_11435 [Terrabacter sp. Root85]|nr:hypothetical protein ASE25_11435 [Terrabacter sp. Root85]
MDSSASAPQPPATQVSAVTPLSQGQAMTLCVVAGLLGLAAVGALACKGGSLNVSPSQVTLTVNSRA